MTEMTVVSESHLSVPGRPGVQIQIGVVFSAHYPDYPASHWTVSAVFRDLPANHVPKLKSIEIWQSGRSGAAQGECWATLEGAGGKGSTTDRPAQKSASDLRSAHANARGWVGRIEVRWSTFC